MSTNESKDSKHVQPEAVATIYYQAASRKAYKTPPTLHYTYHLIGTLRTKQTGKITVMIGLPVICHTLVLSLVSLLSHPSHITCTVTQPCCCHWSCSNPAEDCGPPGSAVLWSSSKLRAGLVLWCVQCTAVHRDGGHSQASQAARPCRDWPDFKYHAGYKWGGQAEAQFFYCPAQT